MSSFNKNPDIGVRDSAAWYSTPPWPDSSEPPCIPARS